MIKILTALLAFKQTTTRTQQSVSLIQYISSKEIGANIASLCLEIVVFIFQSEIVDTPYRNDVVGAEQIEHFEDEVMLIFNT